MDLLEPDDNLLFYTSPYKRTIQTTEGLLEAVKKHNINYRVHEEPRLREQDFGNFQGPSTEMVKVWKERAHYGHFFYRIPNGESAADVYDRVAGFNETLFRQFNTEKFPSVLVLVSHGIWCRVFLMKWFRWSYEKFEAFRNLGHCEFLIMEKGEDIEQKYTLLTPLRTWDDPPEVLLTLPKLERDETSKNSKSLRYKDIRTRDETSVQKQHEKDARIQEAFLKAQQDQPQNKDLPCKTTINQGAESVLGQKDQKKQLCDDAIKGNVECLDENDESASHLASDSTPEEYSSEVEDDDDDDVESMRKSASARSDASSTSIEDVELNGSKSVAISAATTTSTPAVRQRC